MKPINNFYSDESGLELTEYAVAAALVVIAIVVALTDLGDAMANTMNSLANYIRTS